LVYSLAGADCIDVAADPAVVAAAQEGIKEAITLMATARSLGFNPTIPWLMVSLNDGEDPHFRKAEFDPTQCPLDCDRPCLKVCPAEAIASPTVEKGGVIDHRCYGCGRCLPVCPYGLIVARSYVTTPALTLARLASLPVAAIELHTQVGHEADFRRVWQEIQSMLGKLKLLAISCSDHPDLPDYLLSLAEIITPRPDLLLWQLDGRPMSGDIGKGTTHAALRLVQRVLPLNLPGYLQLAGGTNDHTVPKLRAMNLLRSPLAGVAYGSYARSLMTPSKKNTPESHSLFFDRDHLWQRVKTAHQLVSQLKPISIHQR
jgi:Fe-S-cluster-containing hydrogenase component 2